MNEDDSMNEDDTCICGDDVAAHALAGLPSTLKTMYGMCVCHVDVRPVGPVIDGTRTGEVGDPVPTQRSGRLLPSRRVELYVCGAWATTLALLKT